MDFNSYSVLPLDKIYCSKTRALGSKGKVVFKRDEKSDFHHHDSAVFDPKMTLKRFYVLVDE